MGSRIGVDVTQEDIDKAIQNDSSKCVVAQAIARTVPTAHRISVDIQTVRFTDSRGVRRVYLTPTAVEQYIIAFDAGDTIEPFGFGLYDSQRVNVPRRTKTTAGKKRDAAGQKAKKTAERVAALEADPNASPAVEAVAKEKLAAAQAEKAAVFAETSGQVALPPLAERLGEPEEGTRGNRPRGIKKGAGSNDREYGHRRLRINQQHGSKDNAQT